MLVYRSLFVRLTSIALGLSVLAGVARAEDKLWQTDFEAAKTKAKAEKKLLLVDFTGSDWCGWCKKLVAEVFSKDEFKKAAPKNFVLVELDYPSPAKKQSDELKKQNKALAKQYKIQGYPTILVMDADGKVVAKTGYQPGGPEDYVKHLEKFMEAHGEVVKMVKELEAAKGIDRAKQLDKIVDVYATKLNNSDSDEILGWSKEIVALDPDNKTGLKPKYQFNITMADFNGLKDEMKFVEAVAVLKKGIAALGTAPQAGQLKSMLTQVEPMAEAQETIAKLKPELDTLKGLDRAKALDKVIEAWTKLRGMSADITPQTIEKWSKEVVTLDADNKAGLKNKYQFRMLLTEARTLIQEGKSAEGLAVIEKAIALPGITPEQLQQGHFVVAITHLNASDFEKGVESLKKSLKAAPDSQQAGFIKRLIERAEKELESKKAEKKDEKK
jgi:thioredoxin-related protein